MSGSRLPADSATSSAGALLTARDLSKVFSVGGALGRRPRLIHAVDGVSLSIESREVLGLVGESGSGKSTLARLLLRLIPATDGEVEFDGQPLYALRGDALRRVRRQMQIVFQDPYSSFDPRMTVEQSIAEGLYFLPRAARRARVRELLELVGLPAGYARRHPHEFSGGQRQRLAIARALAPNPRFVVADEPVSALDISIQAQVLNLFRSLQRQLGLTYLFVAHDLSVVRHIADRVAVMYRGRIVEIAPKAELYRRPVHPYTHLLLAAAPQVAGSARPITRLAFPAAEALDEDAPGCRFAPRCPLADEHCRTVIPPLRTVRPGHMAACFHAEQSEAMVSNGLQFKNNVLRQVRRQGGVDHHE